MRIVLATALLMVGLLALAQLPAGPRPPLLARSGPALATAKAWGYQLQGARPELIPPEIDLLVIDHARDASEQKIFSPSDIEQFKRRPGAPDRIVLAYMSIGEAETYRAYWRHSWTSSALAPLLKPAWLGRENKEWKGNYLVRYWHPGWQRLIVMPNRTQLDAFRQDMFGQNVFGQNVFGMDLPYIDKILEAGFDGVYLDRVDSFAPWEKTMLTARTAMRDFVQRISAYAKARRPGFLIVPQNGEELLREPGYLNAIDAIAKEDLVFGLDGQERQNPADEIAHASETLSRAQKAGMPVLVVEYLRDIDKQQAALRHISAKRFLPTFAVRDLNMPPTVTLLAPSAITRARPATPPPQR